MYKCTKDEFWTEKRINPGCAGQPWQVPPGEFILVGLATLTGSSRYTRFAWAGGTFFPVVLLCCVSFLFWWEIGFGLHTHVGTRVQYSCGVVLDF